MQEIKVGDRVRVVKYPEDDSWKPVGMTGRVEAVPDAQHFYYEVRLDKKALGSAYGFEREEIALEGEG